MLSLKEEAWWPNLSRNVETYVNKCAECVPHKPVRATDTWTRVHMDNAAIANAELFLIVVDSFSGWLEVVQVKYSSVESLINALPTIFNATDTGF